MKTQTKTSAVAKLISNVKSNELAKVNLNDEQLLELIIEHYSKVDTKSAMLKLIRSENFKVSQDRCYNSYLLYKKAITTDNKK